MKVRGRNTAVFLLLIAGATVLYLISGPVITSSFTSSEKGTRFDTETLVA